MIFDAKAREIWDVKTVTSSEMNAFIKKCAEIYRGNPEWVDEDDNIKTINFAKSICTETARLATLAIDIKIDGSARADWMQEQLDYIYFQLREWVEYGCAYGTIILKPSLDSIDIVLPGDFIVTEEKNGQISSVVFVSREQKGEDFYTRLEYHRFDENGLYLISNRCYIGQKKDDLEKAIAIEDTPWRGMAEDVSIKNMEKPLYGVFRTPNANTIEVGSSLGMPVFADALEELADLDIAYSRNALEMLRSKKLILLDSDRLVKADGKPPRNNAEMAMARKTMNLPDYVSAVQGDGASNFYQEINPELNTATRIEYINNLLSQIGYKCGFSNGYFVFDSKTGVVTATQIEADQQRTIQFIKDIRDKLESCLDGVFYAVSAFADLYNTAPSGKYEATYDFGDITYNVEEDRARWYQYVMNGQVPAWMYFNKFEGMSEEDAKAMVEEQEKKAREAQAEGLF